jgi:hypothetical protein
VAGNIFVAGGVTRSARADFVFSAGQLAGLLRLFTKGIATLKCRGLGRGKKTSAGGIFFVIYLHGNPNFSPKTIQLPGPLRKRPFLAENPKEPFGIEFSNQFGVLFFLFAHDVILILLLVSI